MAALVVVVAPAVAAAQTPAPPALCGRVLDAATSSALENAEVLVTASGGDTLRARTGTRGEWQVSGAEGDAYTIRVRRPGYAAAAITARAPEQGRCLAPVRLTPLPFLLDATVISAARREQRLKDAVAATELISRREIERSGASDVATVLAEHTGIQLDGGTPAGAGVFLQGLGSQHVLVLLDGQPLVGRVNGNFDVSRLPTGMVERVEVVKGPQSTLYGSEAMGGVINVVTREAAADALSGGLSMVGGSEGRRDVNAHAQGGRGPVRATLDVGNRHVDLAPGVSGNNGTYATRWDGQLKAQWQATDDVDAFASVVGIVEDQRYRVGQLYQFSDNEQWAARAGAAWRLGAHTVTPLVYLSRFGHHSRASTNPVPLAGSGQEDVQQLTELEVTYSGPVLSGTMDAGVEWRHERITADRVEGHTRSLTGVEPFAQLTWTRGDVSVTPGARVSVHEQWGTTVTPRLAALWRPIPALGVRASVGRGFRAPDFKELYISFVNEAAGYAVVGNADLRPESSTSASLDMEWSTADWLLHANTFHNRFTNFIESVDAGAPGTFTYANVADGTTSGVETEAAYVVGALRVDGGYGWLRARDGATGGPLLGRAEHSARFGLAYALPFGLRASAHALYTGRTPTQRDASGAVSATRDPFTRLNLRFVQELPQAISVSVGVDNLLDQEPEQGWPGFAGRTLYAGLAWSMGR
jgi:outer membrane receptor for ferrienterochelin and colicins